MYPAIKIIVLLGRDTGKPALSQPSASLQNPVFLANWGRGDPGIEAIVYQGYAYGYPTAAAFPPMYPLSIKIFSLNQPTLYALR